MTSQPNAPLRGAVDLAALSGQREAQQRRAAAMGSAPPGVVIDVTEATFQADVIDRSQTVPVVLDLWATWCGPCKQLSPILEALAAEYAGRFVLAKVDVDAEQRIAAAFQVQSIPSVFAVLAGQPVPMFQGALPEPQVRQVIDELLRVAAENGVTGTLAGPAEEAPADVADEDEDEDDGDPRFVAAYEAIEAGDWAAAAEAYRQVLAASPSDADAIAGVALCELQARVAAGPGAAEGLEATLAAADADAATGSWAAAFDRLVTAVRETAGADRDRVRQRLLDLFAVAGDDPAVAPARLALANALF